MIPLLWLYPLFFISAQLLFFATTGDGVFGNATGGVVESLRLVTTGRAMRWHMFSASAMWVLGAGQFLLKPFRRGRLAWIHRTMGLAFLLLWFLVAGPTAAYLSLFTGNGLRQAQIMMAIFSAVSLETTVWAYYCFWRAWRVARCRANGAASIKLHNKLMACGIFFTMTILYQRPLQFCVIGLRHLLLLLAASLDETLVWTRWAMEGLALTVLDHNVGLSVTTLLFGWFQLYLLDGPRSWVVSSVLGLRNVEVEEAFGSKEPGPWELMMWRLRLPVYICLRGIVTEGWKVDPDSRTNPI